MSSKWLIRLYLDSSLRNYDWLTRVVTCTFTKWGVEFDYHGDWVWWMWPWRRNMKYPDGRWVSTGFDGYFPSLGAIDMMWDEYFEACANIIVEGNHDTDTC